MAEKGTHLDDIGRGTNGSSSVSGISNLGSVDESVELETSEKSVKKPGIINGCSIDPIRKIITSAEMNGEIIGTENAIAPPWKGIGSPEEISNGLENMGSQLKSEGMEKVENPEKLVQFDGTELDVNEVGDSDRHWDLNGKGIEAEETFKSSPNAIGSPPGGSGVCPTEKCAHGSKKWRRKRRDPAKEGGGTADPSRILRVLHNAESVKPPNSFVESKQKSEGSCSSTSVNSAVRNLVFSTLPAGTAFAIGADSENSEDGGSKSSTAASAPRLRLGVSQVTGSAIGKGKMKNSSDWSSTNADHRAQRRKGKVEARKKPRGERVKFERENSYSSVESDLRSSNVVFMEVGVLSKITNANQREGSYYNGVNDDEENLRQLQSSEEARAKYYRKNREEIKVVSRGFRVVSGIRKNEARMNHRPHMDYDPLAKSVILLQAAEEALEREIRKFREIRREPIALQDTNRDITSLAQVPLEETEESNPIPQTTQIAKLTRKETKIKKKRPSYLLERQKSLAKNQAQMDVRLKDAEEKAAIFRGQAEELETSNRVLLELKDDLNLKNGFRKFTFCCFTRLLLLCTVFTLFLLQMYPHSHEIVPT